MSKAILSATITLAVGTLFIAGCATKNYVKQSIQPVDQKIDQVDKSSQSRDSSQVADINKTNQVVDEDEKKLSATDEIAKTADTTSKGAMAKSNQNTKDIERPAQRRREYRRLQTRRSDRRPLRGRQGHAHEGREGQAGRSGHATRQPGALFHHGRGIHGPDRGHSLQRPVEPGARRTGNFVPGGQPRCSRIPDPYGRARGSEADRRRQGQEGA